MKQKLVYKKYVYRKGKRFGPYYCESYRDENNKVRTRFISGPKKREVFIQNLKKNIHNPTKSKKLVLLSLCFIIGIFILLLIGNLNYNLKTTGKVIEEISTIPKDVEIAEKLTNKEIESNVDIREHVNLDVKKKVFEKNKIMEFSIPKGKLELNFDLLNYSEWIEKNTENEIDAENFDINVQESKEKYKWGYNIRLKDLNFMAKIDVSSDKNIKIIDNQTLKIGNNYLSFADLAEQGYVVRVETPAVLGEINISEINVTEINVTLTNITEINITDLNLTTNISAPEQNLTNITIPITNISEIINITTNLSETNVTIPENVTENITIFEENQTEIVNLQNISEENLTEETKIEENITETQEISEQGQGITEATEEIVEQPTEQEKTQGTTESDTITAFFVKSITGFLIKGIGGITGRVIEEENYVSIYIQKDFTKYNIDNNLNDNSSLADNSNNINRAVGEQAVGYEDIDGSGDISVGDIINLDPYLIIIISKAEHLDENRSFMSDIYNDVKEKDNNWSEPIYNNEYVRVTFEQNLTRDNDITIYARASVEQPNNNHSLSECYDNETEILTEKGWKLFKDLEEDEKVATLNAKTGESEWQLPMERQEFDYNDEMYKIILDDGSDLLVSEGHKVYVKESDFLKSSVLNTLTLDCSLNEGSLDQIAQFNFNASANTGISLSCINCLASDSNCSNDCLGIILMNFFNSSNISLNCIELILEYFNTSDSFFFNSSITYSGVDISNPRKSELIIINLTGLSLKKDINMLVSTTNCIFYQPSFLYLFQTPSLILSPSLRQSSSVSSEFSSILSSFLSNNALLTFSAKNCLIDSEKFNSGSLSKSSFNSFGMDNVMFGILVPPVYSVKDVQVFKSFGEKDLSEFSLQEITEIYQEINEKDKEIYFLNSENKPVKIKSIEKQAYNGKIYDVDVDNDIVLVRRKNSTALWSGNSNPQTAQIEVYKENSSELITKFENISQENWYKVYLDNLSDDGSYSQDVFDLKVLGESVEFDYIVDPYIDTGGLTQNVSDCGNLTTENATYYLNTSVNSTATCFNIQANNITLDCNGYEINYSYSTATAGYGVYSNQNFTTIKNCLIKEGSPTTSSKHAIYFLGAKNGTIDNNTLKTLGNTANGVFLSTSSNSNTLTNNYFNTTGSNGHGIRIFSSSNNILTNNTITTLSGGASGIYLYSSSNNNLTSNTITTSSSGVSGIYLFSSSDNSASLNNITTNFMGFYIEGSSSSHFRNTIENDNYVDSKLINVTDGIYNVIFDGVDFTEYGQVIVLNSGNITIKNSNISNNGITYANSNGTIENNNITIGHGIGVYFPYSSESDIIDNIITTSCGYCYGIYLYSSSNSNTLSNNTITTSQSDAYGIYLRGNSNNTIIDNSILTSHNTLAYGIAITDDSYDNIINNSNIRTTGTTSSYGIYIQTDKTNNSIYNTIINATSVYDIYVGNDQDAGSFLKLYNVTWNETDAVILDTDFALYNYNYLDVNVTSGGSALLGANVSSWNSSGTQMFSQLTLASGFIPTQSLLEFYQDNATGVNYQLNYTVNTTLSGYSNDTQSVNMSTNRQLDVALTETTAPTITILAPSNNSIFNQSSVEFNISINEEASWCGLSISGAANQTMTLNSSSTGANYTNSSIADGSYSFIVSCNDTANNYGTSETYNLYIDTVYPLINFTAPTPGNGSSQSATAIFVNVTANDTASNISTFIDFDNSLVGWWRMDDVNASGDPTDISGHCYDNETQILTENGWKFFYELNKNEKVATLNQGNRKLEYQKPIEYQEFDYDDEMYNILLEDGSDFLVSEKHKVYVDEKREDHNNLNSFIKSSVENISISDCSLNASSSDQIGVLFNNKDKAKYGSSSTPLRCGEILLASERNLEYLAFSNVLTDFFNKENKKSNSDSSISENSIILPFLFDISFNTKSGDISSHSVFNNSSTTYLLVESDLKNENNMDASTINDFGSIFDYSPCCLATFCFSSLASFEICSSVNLLLDNISSAIENSTLLTSCFTTLAKANANLSLSSSGTSTLITTSAISEFNEDAYLNVSNFYLQPVAEAYEEINNGKELYFLDENNNPIKVKSITKQPYSGKIYDVDVENDIVLVRRRQEKKEIIAVPTTSTSNNFNNKNSDLIVSNIKSNNSILDSYDGNDLTANKFDDYNNIKNSINLDDKINEQEASQYLADDESKFSDEFGIAVWSGNSNNGSKQGNATQTTAGKLGKAFSFDGDGDYISIPLSGANPFTVSLWAKFNEASRQDCLIRSSPAPDIENQWHYEIYRQADYTIAGETWDGSPKVVDSGINPTVGTWYHLAITATSNSSLYLYVNGVRYGPTAVGTISCCYDYHLIGRKTYMSNWGNASFNGSIDDVMIFNRSLSADEIAALYANTSTKYLGVNFTSLADGSHTFKAYTQDYGGNVNSTETRITTIDLIIPSVNITYPLNTTYNINISALNYTVSDINLQSCWYSTNNGVTNTSVTCGTNLTGLTSTEGSNTWRVYANDSAGNKNSSSVIFTIDSVKPNVQIVSPTNNTNSSNTELNVNYTVSDANLQACWYSNDSFSENTTITCGANITDVTWTEGLHNVTVWANDSAGNKNSSSVIFTIDNIPPIVTLIAIPSSVSSTSIDYLYNATDYSSIANCSLILDGSSVATDTNVNNSGANETITYTTPAGTHIYYVSCIDAFLNTGNSSSSTIVVVSTTVETTTGGGGGGGTRTVSLKIEVPSSINLEEKGKVKIPITLDNDGQTDLNEINLTGYVLKNSALSSIKAEFDKDYFSSISSRKKENVTLTTNIESDEIAVYEIIINASSTSPVYNAKAIVYLNFIGKDASGVKKMIVFTENMIVENPECLELKEMVEDARKAFEESRFEEAIVKSNKAVEACRESISGPKQPTIPSLKSQKNILIYLGIGIILSLILGLIFSIYKKIRFRKK